MVFACQRDSFQTTFTSRVKSCTKGNGEHEPYYEVICEDSVLFPEGGGQPWDTGFINGIPVHQVLRKGSEAVMYVEKPVEVGEEVKQVVNWERRFDHMQQHSGQHLITAIINAEYKFDTTSWWLGDKTSFIELDTKELTNEQMDVIERLANEKIVQQVPVVVNLCDLNDEAVEKARSNGLPGDVSGPIRIVEIVGLESDLCCGTHVQNLGQLQCVKLLHAEKGKKNKTNLHFVAGGRVLRHLAECLNREKGLTKLLNSNPASHVELVGKLQQNVKSGIKKLTGALRVVAASEANKFRETNPQPKYFAHYNPDGDSDYLDCFWRTVREDENVGGTFFLLAAGEENGNGNLLLQGNENDVKCLGPRIAEVLSGKGAARGTKFQAKVSKLSNFSKAEAIVRQYFESEKQN